MASRPRSFLPALQDAAPDGGLAAGSPDRRDGAVYVVDPSVRLAVDVALATHRPLLLRGEPGSGKSSLAAYLARNLGWRYYEHVVTSRTRARDLLWTFDAVRKLSDASVRQDASSARPLNDHDYLEPGVMWWVIDRSSALRRGMPEHSAGPTVPADEPYAAMNADRDPDHAVVLIDEIDKADPDVPNGLLVPLGSTEFLVTETRTLVRRAKPADPDEPTAVSPFLIVITTNEERDLPPAFIRRCIVQELRESGADKLVEIATRHVALEGHGCAEEDLALFRELADRFLLLRREAAGRAARPPSTAEYLDAVRACRSLQVRVGDETWKRLERLVLDKELPRALQDGQ